jgi:hypothetical protein
MTLKHLGSTKDQVSRERDSEVPDNFFGQLGRGRARVTHRQNKVLKRETP